MDFWSSSMDVVHGRCPWTISLSSMGDFVVHEQYSGLRTSLNLLGWFLILSALLDLDDPYGEIGDELISHYPISCPFVQRVVQDIGVIWSIFIWFYLYEPHVAKPLVGLLCQSHFPKEPPRVNFWMAHVVSLTLFSVSHVLQNHWLAYYVDSFPKGTATCQLLSGARRFIDPVFGDYK